MLGSSEIRRRLLLGYFVGGWVMQEPWVHREGVVNGVRLHWVEMGAGPLVVLLHGFPEF